jgi:hypothetical protein
MRFELWDAEARFLLGRFASEEDALMFARTVLSVEGEAYAANLELVIGEDGARNLTGAALVERAKALDLAYEGEGERRGVYGFTVRGGVKLAAGGSAKADEAVYRQAAKSGLGERKRIDGPRAPKRDSKPPKSTRH